MLTVGEQQIAGAERIDPTLRALLDHVAAQLAQEYIRLMEATANSETAAASPAADA